MNNDPKLSIQKLQPHHNKSSFKSGESSLDNYIQQHASQDVKRNLCKVYVATNGLDSSDILGYYSLSSLSIACKKLPPDIAKKLPRYPIPAVLLGRLAVSQTIQKNGIGELLLVDAIKRVKTIDQIGIYAMIVDALNMNVVPFYLKYGFSYLQANSTQLFLPLKPFNKK